MYTISKEFHFSASHRLRGLAEGHPCGRMHGHNYIIIVELQSYDVDEVGFVEDYGKLNDIKQYIDNMLDHRHLNDIIAGNPTAENIAKTIYDLFKPVHPYLVKVSVSETPKTLASYHE